MYQPTFPLDMDCPLGSVPGMEVPADVHGPVARGLGGCAIGESEGGDCATAGAGRVAMAIRGPHEIRAAEARYSFTVTSRPDPTVGSHALIVVECKLSERDG